MSPRKTAIELAETILDHERNHGRYATAMEKAIDAYERAMGPLLGLAPIRRNHADQRGPSSTPQAPHQAANAG